MPLTNPFANPQWRTYVYRTPHGPTRALLPDGSKWVGFFGVKLTQARAATYNRELQRIGSPARLVPLWPTSEEISLAGVANPLDSPPSLPDRKGMVSYDSLRSLVGRFIKIEGHPFPFEVDRLDENRTREGKWEGVYISELRPYWTYGEGWMNRTKRFVLLTGKRDIAQAQKLKEARDQKVLAIGGALA